MIEISSIGMIFSIGIFKDGISKLVSKYKFQLVSIKTLLKTKRRILFRGSFCLVKGKAFEIGGEISKLEKCFLQSYSYTYDFLQKSLKRISKKNLQKQNKWCKCGPKC
jgi:hypothetical protein